VVDLLFDCAEKLVEVGAEKLVEVSYAGAGELCDCVAVGGAKDGCVVYGGLG
jgi:hypothetical protein